MNKSNKIIKIILVGDSTVGKSAIVRRFAYRQFIENYYATIGIDFTIKILNINNINIKLQIWDTAGQEKFHAITRTYYRGSDIVILVFDLTNKKSFDNLENWITEIKEYVSDNCQFVLIGNKIDRVDRCVNNNDIKIFIEKYHIDYYETSAKTSHNVDDLFEDIIKNVVIKTVPKDNFKKEIKNLISTKNNFCCC